MSETNCTHNCSTCGSNCASREKKSLLAPLNDASRVKKVIGVMSGKGGVGKSMVTGLLAVLAQRMGYKTAVLDADITGPSIPRMFGIHEKAAASEMGIMPGFSKTGVRAMSMNLLLEKETDPVVWRGPVIAGVIKQFWSEVVWDDVDIMFIDMPPGTGDVALTVFQSLPVSGIVLVTTPQEMVEMIVEKAVKMADLMHIPVLGLVENMSYYTCPDCGSRCYPFGDSDPQALAEKHGIPQVARMPIDVKLSAACDKGMIELFEGDWLNELASAILKAEK